MGRSRSRSRSKVISRSRSRSRSTTPPPPPTPTSSIDSSSDPISSSALPLHPRNDHDVSRSTHPDTDLRLSLGGVSRNICVPLVGERHREKKHDWPPIKPLLRSTLVGRFSSDGGQGPCLFVKVYMEGVLIGRKLDLLAHHDYDDLVTTLAWMFKTKIHSPGKCTVDSGPETIYILTYEDKDGDWMMVGDVPWEMFKRNVKRLMITRADKC